MTVDLAPWPVDIPAPGCAPPYEPREFRPALRAPHDGANVVAALGADAVAAHVADLHGVASGLVDVIALLICAHVVDSGIARDVAAEAQDLGEALDGARWTARSWRRIAWSFAKRARVNERVAECFADRAIEAESRVEAAKVALVRLEALAGGRGSAEGREAVKAMRDALG